MREAAMSNRFWKIRGYDGLTLVYERAIPTAALSVAAIKVLLQRLACRHLTDDEVVSSSLRMNADGYSPHLEIQTNGLRNYELMTSGTGYHYTALIDSE
jgi:hypothetical protein